MENTHFIVLSTCCCTFQSVSSVCLSQRQHGSYCHIPMYINSYVKPTVRLRPGPSFLSHHKCSSSLMAARGGKDGRKREFGIDMYILLYFKWIINTDIYVLSHFSCAQLFATPWIVAHQAPLSMGIFRQEYWSGLQFPPPGYLPHLGMKPTSLRSPVWQVSSLPLAPSLSLSLYIYI